MTRSAARIAVVQFCFALGVGAIVLRAAQLQLVQGGRWAAEARNQRTERSVLPARRGAIYDRHGIPLAVTQEFYHVGVAPNELVDRRGAVRLLARQLRLPAGVVERELSRKRWAYWHGPFTATHVHPLRAVKGIHLDGNYRRFDPTRGLARAVVGGLVPETGRGASGVELALDSVLTGVPGEAVLLKDRSGRRYDSPSRRVREPISGHDVYLTLDVALQEIAERALAAAIERLKADGGDVVLLDPRTGELLAVASQQVGQSAPRPSTLTDPFEPGSTAKLFTAAALLRAAKIRDDDAVSGEGGTWFMQTGPRTRRRITDTHREHGNLTLARAIEVSSNIAMAKFAQRLAPAEQYETLRDFGFGSPTGVEFPSESRGRLARPDRWQPLYTRASLAMGYEFGVTPVQLAAAYGAIANDGILLTPTLLREVRRADGSLSFRREPEPIRRAVSADIAARLRAFLGRAVADGGTGERGQLANFPLLGKTGTARQFVDGRYVDQYTASFAALFPADDPQLVVIVKIENPKGEYYGGLTAAPITKTMLQQALASHRVAINRSALATAESAQPPSEASAPGAALVVRAPATVVAWPRQKPLSNPRVLPVPDVHGTTVREAALALHRSGFQVELRGMGRAIRTSPAAGQTAAAGTVVTVWTDS
ncbi:MAG TPA: penicillin-binding protein 2 [Gemmatimonadales bacterium]|nr:penicillin-binding protein 2 [Gemmatimonadales bacterium]